MSAEPIDPGDRRWLREPPDLPPPEPVPRGRTFGDHPKSCDLWGGGTCSCHLREPGPPPAELSRPATTSSWARIDLTPYLDGTHVPQAPELLQRTDGHCLLYRGRVHSLHGESESGKSWVALAEAATQLTAGAQVLMLDSESDEATTIGRLLRLGVPPVDIADRFDYRRPECDPAALANERQLWQDLLGTRYALAIIDGVTEALSVYGTASKDNDEVTRWIRSTPRRLAATTGAVVVLVDHVTKDADTRGRFAIGGQAKMAALDGAAYVVEVLDPLGVGLLGRISLRVAKDRPGNVRPHAGVWRKTDRTQEAAVVVIDSRDYGRTTVTVDAPRREPATDHGTASGSNWRPTALMAQVSDALEKGGAPMSRKGIEGAVPGKAQYVRQAIDALLAGGHLAADGPALGGHPSLRLVKPYRQDPTE